MSKMPGTVPQLSKINKSNRDAVLSGSHYYWWFMFLRKNEGYRRYCEDRRDQSFADIYADFGDVHRYSFEEWWRKRGRALFTPQSPSEVIVRIPHSGMASPELYEYPLLVVAFDCTRGEAAIRKSFSEYMKKHLQKRVGRPKKEKLQVDAKYVMTGAPHVGNLQEMYEVLEAIEKSAESKQHQSYAQIAIGIRLHVSGVKYENDELITPDKRQLLAEKARNLRNAAQRAVVAVGKGHFPCIPPLKERQASDHRVLWENDRARATEEFRRSIERSIRQAR